MNLLPVQTSSSSMSPPRPHTLSYSLPASTITLPPSSSTSSCPFLFHVLFPTLPSASTLRPLLAVLTFFFLPHPPTPSLPFPLSTSLYVYPFTPLLSIVTHVSFHLPNPLTSVPSFLLPLASPLPFIPCLTFPNMYPPLPCFEFFPTFSHCCPLPERWHE